MTKTVATKCHLLVGLPVDWATRPGDVVIIWSTDTTCPGLFAFACIRQEGAIVRHGFCRAFPKRHAGHLGCLSLAMDAGRAPCQAACCSRLMGI